jgi:hypothetical protein
MQFPTAQAPGNELLRNSNSCLCQEDSYQDMAFAISLAAQNQMGFKAPEVCLSLRPKLSA